MEGGVCKGSRMGNNMMWQVHKHLMYIFPQAKQCRWLMEIMKPTLGCDLVLDSIYSHGLYLGKGLHLPPYNILWTSSWGLNWNDFCPIIPKWLFQILKLWMLEFCMFINFSYEIWFYNFQLKFVDLNEIFLTPCHMFSLKCHLNLVY
jgi:hypothetical protein